MYCISFRVLEFDNIFLQSFQLLIFKFKYLLFSYPQEDSFQKYWKGIGLALDCNVKVKQTLLGS